jgi:hypothetical protein
MNFQPLSHWHDHSILGNVSSGIFFELVMDNHTFYEVKPPYMEHFHAFSIPDSIPMSNHRRPEGFVKHKHKAQFTMFIRMFAVTESGGACCPELSQLCHPNGAQRKLVKRINRDVSTNQSMSIPVPRNRCRLCLPSGNQT